MALWTPYLDKALDLSQTPVEYTSIPVDLTVNRPDYGLMCYMVSSDPSSYVNSSPSPRSMGYISDNTSSHVSAFSPPARKTLLTPSPPQSPAYDVSNDAEYLAFETAALRAMAHKNGGSLVANNPKMRRPVQTAQAANDVSYRKQRERNNLAAKQSRDRRKLREVRLALQATFLERKLQEMRSLLTSGCCARCETQRHYC